MSHFPKIRMFYGWYIVAASIVINFFIGGIALYGFTALVDPIASTFGWSYAQISLAMTFRGVESGAVNPLAGVAADRWPARTLVLAGVIIASLGWLLLIQTANLVEFYLGFTIVGLGGSLVQMVPMAAIARWFKTNMGKATAVLSMGVSFGALFVPVMVKLIDAHGWRTFLIIVAVGGIAFNFPLAFVFRGSPKERGLMPDAKSSKDTGGPALQATSPGIGVKGALRTRAFWQLGIATLLQMAAASAVILHVMPYLVSGGIERSTASMIPMFITAASLVVRLPYGWLADAFTKKYVLALSQVLTGIGLLVFSRIDAGSFGLIIPFVIIYGLSLGGQTVVRAPLLRQYFGIRNFGTIFGLSSIFVTIGSISGPPLAGWVYDTRGTYDPVWLYFGGVCMVGAILMFTMPAPRVSKVILSGNT